MAKEKKKERFKVHKGYIFDKRIFQICMVCITLFFIFIIIKNGTKPVYFYNCSSSIGCELHPFQEFCHEPSLIEKIKAPGRYDWLLSCGLCDGGRVMEGYSCGSPAGQFQGSEGFAALIFIFFALIVNHFIYNRKFRLEGGVD